MKPHLQLCAGNIPVLLRKAAQRGGRVKLFSTCHTNDFKTNAKLIICGSICVVTEFPKAENLSYLPIAMDRLVNNCITMEELEESAIRQPLSAQLAFIAGRIALRTSLLENSPFPALQVPSILADKQGAPLLPLPMKGSISHKDHLAIGMGVCDFEGYIGVDLEKYRRGIEHKTMPTRRLLTQDEALRIGYMAGERLTL